jgi:prepilin-type N-terminal cleavage/methylation domain-containing protein
MDRNHKSGFTLVEIMIVVVFISLLTAIAVPALKGVMMSLQNAQLTRDLRTFAGTMESDILETGESPEDSSSGVLLA